MFAFCLFYDAVADITEINYFLQFSLWSQFYHDGNVEAKGGKNNVSEVFFR